MYILEDLILPKSQKIKAIRKYLKINQQDLAGDRIDRSLISYIENGKTKLTRDTANIIALNLGKILRQKKLDFNVSGEYIFADESHQVGFLLDSYIDKLIKFKNSNDESFKIELGKIEDILNEWDISSKKAKVFEIAGDYYYEKSLNEESKIYYLKSLENYSRLSDYNNMADINSKIARCALKKNNYEEASYINMHVLYMIESNNIDNPILEKRVLFNNALANVKLKRFETGMEMLEKLKTKLKDDEWPQYTEVLILQANIHIEKCENYEALNTFEQILTISKNTGNRESEAMANNNLGYIYRILNNYDKSIYYYAESLHIREKINSKFMLSTLVSLAETYFINREKEYGQKYLIRALQIIKSKNDIPNKYKIYTSLLDIFMNTNCTELEQIMYDDIIDLIKQNKKEQETQELIIKLCRYYIKHDIERVKNILEIAL
ncbi:tetratricopeptide repeat protein [Brassicibacter mesophilus]|uniref:tetratricopeptide repeat protein n=1 Tax=Brassicibacter mesophilus TaxID=745119 RepID=UPI003D22B3CC